MVGKHNYSVNDLTPPGAKNEKIIIEIEICI